MMLLAKVAQPKVIKRRSRSGCVQCREKRKKCDESRPRCIRCAERGLGCTYQPVPPWKKKESKALKHRTAEPYMTPEHEDDSLPTGCHEELEPLAVSHWRRDHLALPSPPGSTSDSPVDGNHSFFNTDPPYNLDVDLESNIALAQLPDMPLPETTTFGLDYQESPLVFDMPVFSEFSNNSSERGLLSHFSDVLSHLIVFTGESENPFLQLILPLAYNSVPLSNALYAFAGAHREYLGVGTEEKSSDFYNHAVHGLAELIEQDFDQEEALAVVMVLVYYEALVQKGESNLVGGHLRGAFHILSSITSPKPTGVLFLERAFRYYDVISSLSTGAPPLQSFDRLPPLSILSTGSSPLNSVDTLLGAATDLWPILYRLCDLISLKHELRQTSTTHQGSKAAVLRAEYEATCSAIHNALTKWQPPSNLRLSPSDNASTSATKRAILANALAYRHSALVYLHRTILEKPRGDETVQQHVHASLTQCLVVVTSGGPVAALLWPLFVAACEAKATTGAGTGGGAGDRGLARQVFLAVEGRQGMANIEKARAVVVEVWRRADLHHSAMAARDDGDAVMDSGGAGMGADLWRVIAEEMGLSLVLG